MVHEPISLDLTDRRSLMASLPKGGIGAEIGVAAGGFSVVLLEVCEPKLLYLIDPWIHQTAGGIRDDASNGPQSYHDGCRRNVQALFAADTRVKIIREYSLLAVNAFENESCDWWHLDGDHTMAKQDIEAWWPKLKPGGWATGHDYTMVSNVITVKRAVDEFVAKHGLLLFVTRGENDEHEKNYPTWAIQKP